MRKLIKILGVFAISVIAITLSNSANATYQSVYKEDGNYLAANGYTWIYRIRLMESTGEVMGLNANINGTYLTSDTNNNIDVHMQKNTEYGTMILLGASKQYGKKGVGSERNIIGIDSVKYDNYDNTTTEGRKSIYVGMPTTTGNVYGVYVDDLVTNYSNTGNGIYEHVAAEKRHTNLLMQSLDYTRYKPKATQGTGGGSDYYFNSKYYNEYENSSVTPNFVSKAGDAALGWQYGNVQSLSVGRSVVRGNYYSTFEFINGNASESYYSRAVIVNGENF